MQDTVIKVGTTELDGYGNLMVTPSGGGDRIKIAQKRSHLHHLFGQGDSLILHWETYMNKPYVADAKLVEGTPVTEHTPGATTALPSQEKGATHPEVSITGAERGLWSKETGEWMRTGKLREWVEEKKISPEFAKALVAAYWANMMIGLGIRSNSAVRRNKSPR